MANFKKKGNYRYGVIDDNGEFPVYEVIAGNDSIVNNDTIIKSLEGEYLQKIETTKDLKKFVTKFIGDREPNEYEEGLFTLNSNIPVVNQLTKINTVYEVRSRVDLEGGSIEIPDGSSLKINGGYFVNGTIVGNNTKIICDQYVKGFGVDVSFLGTWFGFKATPQNFGAITNKDNTVFDNDCSASIQAAINSPFAVHFPAGYYYSAITSYITRSKSISLEQGVLTGEERGNFYTLDLDADHARIYTDQDIDMFIIQAENVNFKGGLIDYSKADTVTYKAAFRYDLNYTMWGADIDTIVIGNKDTIGVHENGISGIIVDNTNITTEGFLTFVKWKVYGHWVRAGVIVEDKTNHSIGTWANSFDININLNGFKQAVLLYIGGNSRITGMGQSRGTRSDLEKDISVIEAAGAIIDFMCWDVASKRGTQAPWGVSDPIITDLGGCVLVGNSFRTSVEYKNTVPFSPYPIVNASGSIITKNNYDSNFVISQLHNQFAAASKRFTVTTKAHSGEGFDFNTVSESGLPETNNITIANKDNLFASNSIIPPEIVFSESANLELDFIEIVVSGGIGKLKELLISFRGDGGNRFRRIQVIERNGAASTIHDYTLPHSLLKVKPIRSVDKIIIRFIGATAPMNTIRLLDICATRVLPDITPFISVDGGQRIYGDLTTEQYRLSSLNTAPSSATDTGIAGEIRFTTDFIYTCIATNTWVRTPLTTW